MKCCFIGHRKIDYSEELHLKIKNILIDMIENKDVKNFIFGSKSQFNDLCYKVVTELRLDFPFLKRICYTCANEMCSLVINKKYWTELAAVINYKNINFYEEEFEYKTKYTAGKASYIERNYAMIDNSDYVIFYYDENYEPPMRKYSKRSFFYQPKSGTKLAYLYAKQKKKNIINIFK